jgi:membrane protein DedA with SNARE-associated domain
MSEILFTFLPPDFAAWHPVGQAAALFLATFVLEDAAALGAGLLLGTEGVGWAVAFWSCFLGIWIGDTGLYALARWLGRPWFERSRFAKHATAVTRSEVWFQRRGLGLLVFSRMLPGARLPTYLAAGFLRVPLGVFLAITGLASLAWTALVLGLSRPIGGWLQRYFDLTTNGMLWIVGGIVITLLICGVGRQLPWRRWREERSIRFQRWSRWEFWPPWVFYLPVALYCIWLAIKYRGLSLPAAANPGIFTGGLVGESKMATLAQLMQTSPEFTAATALITGESGNERIQELQSACADLQLAPPFILKPDLGQRGAGVKLIRNWSQAEDYLRASQAPMVVQRYAPGPFEVGVFYYRLPHEDRGHIFTITEKIFPELTGDGISSIAQLIGRDSRARLIRGVYLKRFGPRSAEVPAAGERVRLVEAGNHAQGCIFRDGRHLMTSALEQRIDEIARGLDQFYIGRFDIRHADAAAFARGEAFDIVELNGAAAEATSIYDARNPLWTAYRTLFRQWDLVFAIGAANHRAGHRSANWLAVLREWLRYRKLAASYAVAD